jgi:pyruvate formate lyase activating enzyme
VGQVKTVQEVMDVLEKERVFMEESGGGVTFSGGEPMLQHEFLLEILKACKTVGLHTTVDTSGFAAPSFLRKIIPFTDLFLYDLKLMDSEKHRFYTGIPNKIILENLQGLSSLNSKIRIRIPIIHDINDNDENTNQTIGFLKNLLNPVEGIDLLPFHNTANGKYKRFEINYTMNENKKPDDLVMNKLKQQFEDAGLEVKIGG